MDFQNKKSSIINILKKKSIQDENYYDTRLEALIEVVLLQGLAFRGYDES